MLAACLPRATTASTCAAETDAAVIEPTSTKSNSNSSGDPHPQGNANTNTNNTPPLAPRQTTQFSITNTTSINVGSGREAERRELADKLRLLPEGVDETQLATVLAGVAYHHAGLTGAERTLLEEAFRNGVVQVLVATSTLSTGVNLPARRVIFRAPAVGSRDLSVAAYRQMSGRAGRAGKDTHGDSILICRSSSASERAASSLMVRRLFGEELPPLRSCLAAYTDGLARALLEPVASNACRTLHELRQFVECSLLALQTTPIELSRLTDHALADLSRGHAMIDIAKPKATMHDNSDRSNPPTEPANDDLRQMLGLNVGQSSNNWNNSERRSNCTLSTDSLSNRSCQPLAKNNTYTNYNTNTNTNHSSSSCSSAVDDCAVRATRLGQATFAAGFAPNEAREALLLLLEAQAGLVLSQTLHLCYLLAPTHSSLEPPWDRFFGIYHALPQAQFELAERLGVRPSFLAAKAAGGLGSCSGHPLYAKHKRFFNALVLDDLVNEKPLPDVSAQWGFARGALQTLQSSAATYAATLSVFCERLGWRPLALVLAHFKERLDHGVGCELLPLMRLDHVKAFRARVLYNAGYTRVELIASAQVESVARSLQAKAAFQSAPADYYRKTAKLIIASARQLQDAQPAPTEAINWVS
jgi:DNA polymerase theta